MRMGFGSRFASVAAVGCLAPLLGSATAPADDVLPAAASDEHLWFVVELTQPNRRVVLRHHALEMNGPYYTRGLPLSRVPAAMAAWGNRLWIVYAPKRGQDEPCRETFIVQVGRNPAIGGYYYTPHDRLGVVEPLEGLGRLAGFVATAQGPVALLLPTQRAGAGVRAGADSIAAEPVLPGPKLLQLRGQRWTELPLPESFAPGQICRLGVGGEDGHVLVLVTETPGDRHRSTVYRRDAGGSWAGSDAMLELRTLRSLTRVEANITPVTQDRATGRVEIAYLRPGLLLPLPGFATPAGRWTVLGMRDGLRLIEHAGRDELTLRRIDPLTGEISLPQPMTRQPLMTGRGMHVPLLFAVAVAALLIVFLLKPGAKTATVALPQELAALAPVPRLIAVAIDLAAGGLVAAVVLGCTPAELLRFPSWTADLSQATPSVVMIAVTVAHCTLGELVRGRTLGKAFVGARVVAAAGSRPTPAAIIVRNVFKALVLLVPLLAVCALLNPHLQGLGDLVARTVVVGRAAERSAPPSNDR